VLSFTQNRFWRALNITAGLSRIFKAAYSIESVIFDAEKDEEGGSNIVSVIAIAIAVIATIIFVSYAVLRYVSRAEN
jgi:hypothetical protein